MYHGIRLQTFEQITFAGICAWNAVERFVALLNFFQLLYANCFKATANLRAALLKACDKVGADVHRCPTWFLSILILIYF